MDLLLWFFIVAPVFDLAVCAILLAAWRKDRGNSALWERLVTGTALFANAAIISALAWNRVLELHVPDDIAATLLTIAVLITSIPSVNWLWMFWKNKF